jgi:hypothetical protein
MPSIIPSYIYTLFAAVIVGTIAITSCALVTVNVKAAAEEQQLSNIANYVATQAMELAAVPPVSDFAASATVEVPALIGNQRYLIQIQNDQSQVWVQVNFGDLSEGSQGQRTQIPFNLNASGSYLSGSGPAFLKFVTNQTGSYLSLVGGS